MWFSRKLADSENRRDDGNDMALQTPPLAHIARWFLITHIIEPAEEPFYGSSHRDAQAFRPPRVACIFPLREYIILFNDGRRTIYDTSKQFDILSAITRHMFEDQKAYWNSTHAQGAIDRYSAQPTALAEEFVKLLSPQSTVLELGCGAGNDAAFFAQRGHQVTATDFSEVAIDKAKQRYTHIPTLRFREQDMTQPFPFHEDAFDAVYARLSLHYFTHTQTQGLFREIQRILKPGGLLCFMCKSTKDPLYGRGKKIEEDMFEYGHVRHFFSEAYARKCLENGYTIEKMESGEEIFYGDKSAFVKVIARKTVALDYKPLPCYSACIKHNAQSCKI